MLLEMLEGVSYYHTPQAVTHANITGRARELALVFCLIMGPIVAVALILSFTVLIGSALDE